MLCIFSTICPPGGRPPQRRSLPCPETPAPAPALLPTAGTVVAPLVDCGLGLAKCPNATGKVCLIERGTNFFCQKVANCTAGGGVAAVV